MFFLNLKKSLFKVYLCFLILVYPVTSFSYEKISLWGTEAEAGSYKSIDFSKNNAVKNRAVKKVISPELIYIPPKGKSNHSAILIVPGGGFSYIMMDAEGINVAKKMSNHGYSSFILIYRLPHDGDINARDDSFSDVQRALRLIRFKADYYAINKQSIGVMGFSAGGYLAANLSNNFDKKYHDAVDDIDKVTARPDFSALIYPVISLKDGITHKGTRSALIGKNAGEQTIEEYSQELLVTKETPPTFIVHALDDGVASSKNSVLLFNAINKNKINVEMHLFHQGGHGFSIGSANKGAIKYWPEMFFNWQQAIK